MKWLPNQANYHLTWLPLWGYVENTRSALSKFQVYKAELLTIDTMLPIRYPEFIHFVTGSFYPLTNISPSPDP